MNECKIEAWILNNSELLGFSTAVKIPERHGLRGSPYGDIILVKNRRIYRAEIEEQSSNFFYHKPEIRKEIDVLIAVVVVEPRAMERKLELRTKQVIELSKISAFLQWYEKQEVPWWLPVKVEEESREEIEELFGQW